MDKLQWRALIDFFTSQFRLIPWLSSSASDVLLDTVVTVIRDVRCCVAMHVQYMLQLY